ncbi:MAG: hypothetical protein QNL12_05160 [Acidimicrobiia bacterium]|nr:hypothetical protein [Acidimicrobiia bacterium]MDX2466680.1 hypothetical protein [Acidimicrobiia bacterium]
MVRLKPVVIAGMVLLLAASCSGDEDAFDETDTSTTAAASIMTLADAVQSAESSTVTTVTSAQTTISPELSFPEYRIISREASESGDVVVVLLDTTTYESLSDIDVHNVMSDLVEQYAPVFEAHIVETQAAADALFVEEPSEAEQTALDNDYIARLEEGFRIVYVGPLEASGVAILGS